MISNTLFRKSYSAIRIANGSYVNGLWVSGAETDSTITASIQPLSAKEVESENVGRDQKGAVKVYTNDILNISQYNDTTKTQGDIVIYDGDKYELLKKYRYDSDLITHYKYIGEYRGAVD